jgi:hypothetical protein
MPVNAQQPPSDHATQPLPAPPGPDRPYVPQQAHSQPGGYAPYQAPPKPGGEKKHRTWPWVVGIITAFLVGIGIGGSSSSTTTVKAVPGPTVTKRVAGPVVTEPGPTVTKIVKQKVKPAASTGSGNTGSDTGSSTDSSDTGSMTTSQEQAIGSAKDYLSYQAFSRAGLIGQLSSKAGEGFSLADATFAVDHIQVNWNEQAAKSAKDYLSFEHFSRQGLIEQLESKSGDGYTHAQAVYGVNKAGL